MIFCHIVDDYYLQGILASMKQKKWWKDNAPAQQYRYDWICALIEHAFSWTFCVMLPIIVAYYLGYIYFTPLAFVLTFVWNWFTHSLVDNLKANCLSINLCQDQGIHLIQIIFTWILFIV
jgi:hypothetical protein